MAAHRTAIDVTGHNISNAHTEGYRKQEVVLAPTSPFLQGGDRRLPIGTGVEVESVKRRQDRYLDREIYRRQGEMSMWETRSQVLYQVEDIIGEPRDNGLGVILDRFWSCWQDLAGEADSAAMRTAVIERGRELGDAFLIATGQLENMLRNLEQTITTRVERVNTILDELAEVSDQIVAVKAGGVPPNDLMDRRDVLVERLSSLVDIQVSDSTDGGVRVLVDGTPVLDGFTGRRLIMVHAGDEDGSGRVSFEWVHEGGSAVSWEPSSVGELGALAGLRNEDVPQVLEQLRDLADAVRTAVNDVHGQGYDLNGLSGVEFFSVDASRGVLQVNPDIIADPDLIAAAGSAEAGPGDGRGALEMSALREGVMEAIGGCAPGEFLRSLVADVGVRTEQAGQMHHNSQVMLVQLMNQRDAVTGVSIDEELTYLIQAQNAFTAAARLVSVWDEMLNTIVNGLVR